MVALSRVVVNGDGRGNAAPDAIVWDQVGVIERETVDVRVTVDRAWHACSLAGLS